MQRGNMAVRFVRVAEATGRFLISWVATPHKLDARLEELKITSQISVYAMRLGPEIQLLSKIWAVLGLTEKRKP